MYCAHMLSTTWHTVQGVLQQKPIVASEQFLSYQTLHLPDQNNNNNRVKDGRKKRTKYSRPTMSQTSSCALLVLVWVRRCSPPEHR